MMRRARTRQRGDTIIEVILAVTVFSAVAVSVISIMNQGVATVQRSLEITLARQQIDSQAEMLRYVYDRANENDTHYLNLWQNDISQVTVPSEFLNEQTCPDSVTNGFVFVPSGGGLINVSEDYTKETATYAKLAGTQAQGLSIQLTRVNDGYAGGAFDAYIQACWNAPGSSAPVTIGTIVRLYDSL